MFFPAIAWHDMVYVRHFTLIWTNLTELFRPDELLEIREVFNESLPDMRVSDILIRLTHLAPISNKPVGLNLNELSSAFIQKPSTR